MNPEFIKLLDEFIDDCILNGEDPLAETYKILKKIHDSKIAKLEKEIARLKKVIAELEGAS